MPRFNEIINNFINGEVSPKIYGRMDSEIYKRSCRELKNMIVHPQGGASRRVGTQMLFDAVPEVFDVSTNRDNLIDIQETARIIPFVFSENEKYLLVFNKNQGVSLGDNQIHVYFVDEDKWDTISANNLIIGATGPASSRIPTDASSIQTSDQLQDTTVLQEMQYAQAGNTMVFVHENFPPFCVIRSARGVLNFSSYFPQFRAEASTSFGPMPFMDMNVSDVTLTLNLTTVGTGRTLTSSASFFNPSHVGTMFAFQDGGNEGVGWVESYTSPTQVSFNITRGMPAAVTSGTTQWFEGAWSDYRGWPRTINYWRSALFFGGSPTFPDTIWKSQDFDIFEMSNEEIIDPAGTVTAADPFKGTLSAANGVQKINYLANSGNDLLVGTLQREYAISDFNKDAVTVKPQTGHGAEYVQPVIVDDTPVYVQRGFRKVREILFEERSQTYISPEVTFLAEHMPRKSKEVLSGTLVAPKIKHMAYQPVDNAIIWFIDNNGFLFSCTKDRQNSVTAFEYHEVDGLVKSIAVLPSKNNTFDELYMLVKRTINSAEVVYLEKLSTEFFESSLNENAEDRDRMPVFADSAKLFRRSTPNFWVQLKDGVDADISDGIATGTETGTVTYHKNRAVFDTSTYVSYDGTSNADFTQAGCIRCYANADYSNGTIFAISQSNASANNLIRLRVDSSNQIRLTINDSTGTAIINDVVFGDDDDIFYADGPMLFEVNYDITNGATRLFIDGKQIGTTDTSTGTRNTSIDNIVIGANYDGSNPWAGYLYDFQIFDSVQHTSDFNAFEFQALGDRLYKLDHLEGETVAVTVNGIYAGDFTVSGGEIADIGALGGDYSTYVNVVVGLKYEHKLEIQPIDFGSGVGSAMGSVMRVDRCAVRFRASAAAKIGPDTSNLEDVIFRDNDTPMGDPIVLVTDDKYIDFQGDYDRTASAIVTHDAPLPCNVTCISLRGVEYDV